jgi:phosphohistidine phosphatase
MKLYLMRHGQAANKDVDPEQGLTNYGKSAIEQLAHKLLDQGMRFSQVMHSEKTRARQTAEIMSHIISPDAALQQRKNLTPNSDPADLLEEINDWSDGTLVVSHLPFIPNLLKRLVDSHQVIALEPGTVVCLSKKGPQWQVDWIMSP